MFKTSCKTRRIPCLKTVRIDVYLVLLVVSPNNEISLPYNRKYILVKLLGLSGPPWVYLLDLVCSGIQFYVLLSLCFISFLYLDLYVFGDNALISWGSSMQTKYLCVLIQI